MGARRYQLIQKPEVHLLELPAGLINSFLI
jgi:hypothetical protein